MQGVLCSRLSRASANQQMGLETGVRPELPFDVRASGIIAVLRIRRLEFLPVLAGYLWDAGIGSIELSVTMEDSVLAVTALSETPSTVGVGDVVDVTQAEAVIEAGARFVSSPATAGAVIRHCTKRGVAAIPVAGARSEVETAWRAGASAVKLACGVARVRLMACAYPRIPLVATGGIDDRTAAEHIRAGACAVAAEDWLLADADDGGSLDQFQRRATRLVAAVAAASLGQ
jgi:2-dehydro-3-deoxyphosphogluconate aldolase / (4S)-4-hydroxy-2-oxoglutarate aldolase